MYLDYKGHKAGVYVVDIETDDLDATKIWVMCWLNVLTGEKGSCIGEEEVAEFFQRTRGASFIGHNILKFDAPVIRRLGGVQWLDERCCIDTLVLSTLYSPSLEGGHSLDAWGKRLGEPKTEFNDWSGLSQEMIDYCHQDVLVTGRLFVRLIATMKKIGFTEQAIWISHHKQVELDEQHKNGFCFNNGEANTLRSSLRQKEAQLQDEVREVFPAERVLVATRKLRKKNGDVTAQYLRDRERYIIVEQDTGGSYEAYEDVQFNLGSPKQRIDKLLSLGWKPKTFTAKGSPKPFEKGELSPCLAKLLEEKPLPQVKLIAEWMLVNGRANMINTWMENYNEADGRIHGKLFLANTLRFRHQAPNTGNIPAVRLHKETGEPLMGSEGDWTYEARDLWTCDEGRRLVGTDASGLELRVLAHYLNRPDFTEQVVDGDPHQYNADLAGISRPAAKTLIYATLYGAGDAKIAATLGVPLKEGRETKRVFLEKLGADKLIEECKYEQSTGRVPLCDGSWVVCPSPHAALNYKLQGGGSRIMSLASILLRRRIRHLGLDSRKVGDIHDEWQFDVHPRDAESHARESVQAIRKAGELLKLNVPFDGEAKQGLTWAETH